MAWRRAWTGARPTPAGANTSGHVASPSSARTAARASSRGASPATSRWWTRGSARTTSRRGRWPSRTPRSSLGSNGGGGFIFTGADDAAFKGWDLRAGLDRSPPAFVNSRTHGAGVTCVAPSPHDPHVVATGSYDDKVRLWDCRGIRRPTETCDGVDCGGGTWRLRWHPERRAMACAAMGGGVAIVDWSGRESRLDR